MPTLPSGKHIALDPSPIQKLVDDAINGISTHKLMEIESIDHLFSNIDIVYFRVCKQPNKELSLAKFSIVPPDGMEPYSSGFNLISIKNEVEKWPTQDRDAFIDFLNEERANLFMEDLLKTVKKYQENLTDNPATLQGMLALWWKLGIHPLQDDSDEEDGKEGEPPG